MKIGDEVFVHGYVDEIRQGVVIIRNEGGYFGTVEDEVCVVDKDEPQTGILFTDKDDEVWEWRGDAWYCISDDGERIEE